MTAIFNEHGRLAFPLGPQPWRVGSVHEGPARGTPRLYPQRRNAWDLDFTGDIGLGTIGATWTSPDGMVITVELEIEDDGGGGFEVAGEAVTTADDVAALWAAALLEHPDSGGRVFGADVAGGTVTVTGEALGLQYTLDGETSLTPVAQVLIVRVIGNSAGLYRIALTVGDEAPVNIDFTATTETIEQIRDELELAAAALDPDPAVTFGTVDTDELTITSDVAGVPISVVLTSPSADLEQEETTANVSLALTASEAVEPNGGPIPVGRFVVLATIDGADGVRLPEAGDTAGMVAGLVLTDLSITRPDAPTVDDAPAINPGTWFTPIDEVGATPLVNSGDIASAAMGQVYVVVDPAGGVAAGLARADADGGNAVAPTLFSARWLGVVAPGETGLVQLTRR